MVAITLPDGSVKSFAGAVSGAVNGAVNATNAVGTGINAALSTGMSAIGNMPATIAKLVMRIGRRREEAPFRAASIMDGG